MSGSLIWTKFVTLSALPCSLTLSLTGLSPCALNPLVLSFCYQLPPSVHPLFSSSGSAWFYFLIVCMSYNLRTVWCFVLLSCPVFLELVFVWSFSSFCISFLLPIRLFHYPTLHWILLPPPSLRSLITVLFYLLVPISHLSLSLCISPLKSVILFPSSIRVPTCSSYCALFSSVSPSSYNSPCTRRVEILSISPCDFLIPSLILYSFICSFFLDHYWLMSLCSS